MVVTKRESTATWGRVFPDPLFAIAILWAGASLVVFLAGGVGHPALRILLGYLGSSLVVFLAVLAIFIVVVLTKNGTEEPDLSPLVYSIPFVAALTLGAGLYYLVHVILVVPSLVYWSELLGGLVVFGGGWVLLVSLLERRRNGSKDAV